MAVLKEKLGKRIRELRKLCGFSQEQLAELMNMDIPNLSNIERGKRFMTAETLEKFAKALNTTERELFDFSKTEPERYLRVDIEKVLEKFDDNELKFILDIVQSYANLKNR